MNAQFHTQPKDLRQKAPDAAFDILVLGGGIVGAGIARDAALRGLKTALIDRHDFAFGTSSRSSRLLHGGIRYLAQGHFRLVREASVEKAILHQIAPHLAEPLSFIFPHTAIRATGHSGNCALASRFTISFVADETWGVRIH